MHANITLTPGEPVTARTPASTSGLVFIDLGRTGEHGRIEITIDTDQARQLHAALGVALFGEEQ